ncbi:MAG: DUF4124 domain-containing protein [Deltaproteobacteria bacterium]|nr:DUF4124 domain-containing protein [Deltaproteobacteria bacterium]
MKKVLILICNFYFLSLIFNFSPSHADIYEWVDDKGVANFSDDITKVPPVYKNRVKVHKQKSVVTAPSLKEKASEDSSPAKGELIGDYPLEWWKTQFEEKKKDISEIEKIIADQRRYIEIFQKGRRIGQIYSKEDIDVYNEYTKQIPLNEKKLEKLKKELEKYKKKALQSGVPRSARK